MPSVNGLVCGGDELTGLRAALDRPTASIRALLEQVDFTLETFDPGTEAAFKACPGRDFAALLLGDLPWGELAAEATFDLAMISVDAPDFAEKQEVIPLNTMRRQVSDMVETAWEAALRALAASAAPVRICAGPQAPSADDGGGNQRAAVLRLKLWTLQQQCLSSFCRERGLVFLSNPQGSRSQAGFIRQGLSGISNAAYGTMVLEQIARAALYTAPDLTELI